MIRPTPVAIEDNYDPGAVITASSDPASEFRLWEEFAANDPEWAGDEFTEKDFAEYIGDLQLTEDER